MGTTNQTSLELNETHRLYRTLLRADTPHIHLPAIAMASTLLQGLATGKPRSNTCAALNYNASYPTVRRWIPWR
ncbi:MAG: hypothetical protein ACPHLJ_11280, partial [Acidimicrobiales bacterium]